MGAAAGKALYLHDAVFANFAPTTTATISSDIAGEGGLKMTGAGKLTLSATNSYTGATTVEAGTLVVSGSIATSRTTVKDGGTLGGSGTVGVVDVEGGGIVSPDQLKTGNLSFSPEAVYKAELGGVAADTIDLLDVTGTVELDGATLELALVNSFSPTTGSFTIIANDGSDAISGHFNGLGEGGSVSTGGRSFTISYVGGDGNDVVLTATAAPAGPSAPSAPAVSDVAVARAFKAMTTLPISDTELARANAAIQAGTLTLDSYIASLVPQIQHSVLPGLVVTQFFGTNPSEVHLGELAAFGAAQFATYTAMGVADPALGPYEALGLGMSETVTFASRYGALSDADFLAKAYGEVFGRAPTSEQAAHFAAQIQSFEAFYAGAGQSEAQADLHAKGAILGQMLGYVVVHEAPTQLYDDVAIAFLQDAARGQPHYGEGILA